METTKINTEQSDFSSAFFGEDKLVFSSTYQASGQRDYDWTGEPFLDLYIADIGDEGQLENTQQIEGDINTAFHESSAVFTKDLKTVYFTRNNYKNGKKRTDRKNTVRLKLLKASVDEDGNWSDVEELPFNNDNYSVAHPALSLDGKKLFFASDMPGTTGESDLWYVDIYKDGSYGDPINLGQKVNTEGRESFPYIADDGTLYFTSDALIGFGGFDVFKAELSDSGIARDPENMGLPINSAGDDFGFLLQTDTNTGYISSNRDGNRGSASDQIYYFKPSKCVVEITGLVRDSNTGNLMPGATVKLLDMGMNIIAEQIVQQDARYSFPEEVECGQAYYLITENGLAYSIAETTFVAPTTSQSVSVDMEIETFSNDCPPYDLGCLLGLNPIYFDLNKYFIRPDAEIELTKVFNAMIRFPELIIRIESHTDSRSPQSYNLRLSQNRATSTRNWLIQRGIAPSRLSAVGYGESQLINRCADGVPCTEAEHQLNRRSMFIIENYQMLPTSMTSTPNRPTQAYSQVPRPIVNTPTPAACAPPIHQQQFREFKTHLRQDPLQLYPQFSVTSTPNAIPPVVTSQHLQWRLHRHRKTHQQGQEEPAAIVIQVNPKPTAHKLPPNAPTETSIKTTVRPMPTTSKYDATPCSVSNREALQILENHRNQSGQVTPKPPASQASKYCYSNQAKTSQRKKILQQRPKLLPKFVQPKRPSKSLENHRKKTQSTNKIHQPIPTINRRMTQTKPVNLPNENAPADTLDTIVAKLKIKAEFLIVFQRPKAF